MLHQESSRLLGEDLRRVAQIARVGCLWQGSRQPIMAPVTLVDRDNLSPLTCLLGAYCT